MALFRTLAGKLNQRASSFWKFESGLSGVKHSFREFRLSLVGSSDCRRSVDIRIELQGGQVGLIVRDYGKGVRSEKLGSFQATGGNFGVGVTGMRERILELGGNLQLVSESSGISVRATIPIGQERVEKTRPFIP